jgi:ribosome-associated heat shock protein Hsp15
MGAMTDTEPVRVDKWLWAARIVKTRALAAEAVRGGRVHINDRAAKPSKEVGAGDRLEVTIGQTRLELIVRGTAHKRGPAPEAQLLYEETEASREARERIAAQRRLAVQPMPDPGARPTKRDRRRLDKARAEQRRRG